MRMSCNGCRVLRKGCSENCSIRPCLQWIISSESQANATVFLAKFYGRAGLMNLINAGPEHLRPAIFRSLLYEACGRIVNPIYGAVGLLCSGSWQLCQNAVDAVLGGSPITTIASDAAAASVPPIKGCDIRHVAKDENSAATESAPPTRCFDVEHGMEDENSAAASGELHRVKNRTPFKRSRVVKPKATKAVATPVKVSPVDQSIHPCGGGSTSHESTVSHETAGESMVSDETAVARAAAAVAVAGSEPEEVAKNAMDDEAEEDSELDLDLTLGFRAISRIREPTAKSNGGLPGGGACKMELGLDHSC